MKLRRIRILGGPRHGDVQTHTNEGYFRFTVPVYTRPTVLAPESMYHAVPFQRIEYETRTICLGPQCRVEVFVPDDMAEAEMYRRLADLIEGVGERTRA